MSAGASATTENERGVTSGLASSRKLLRRAEPRLWTHDKGTVRRVSTSGKSRTSLTIDIKLIGKRIFQPLKRDRERETSAHFPRLRELRVDLITKSNTGYLIMVIMLFSFDSLSTRRSDNAILKK